MVWVKLDDQFFTRAKAQRAGRDGRALYLAGLCFCAANLTDGVITENDLRFVAASAEVRPVTYRKLIEVGLWEEHPKGFEVHDYLEYNPSAEQVKEERRVDRERKQEERRKGGKRKPSDKSPPGRPTGQRGESDRNPEVPSRPTPVPSHSRGVGVDSEIPSSSSSAVALDDDAIEQLLSDTWALMAYQRLERRRLSEPIRDRAAYVNSTVTKLAEEFVDEAKRLVQEGLATETGQLAELLDAGEETGVATSVVVAEMRRPPCSECESGRVVEVEPGVFAPCPACSVKASA